MESYKIKQVFAVHGDGGERGIGPIIGYCETSSEADIHRKGQGWWGDGEVTRAYVIEVDGMLYALARQHPIKYMSDIKKQEQEDRELRKKTLESLTQDQRRVLGVYDTTC